MSTEKGGRFAARPKQNRGITDIIIVEDLRMTDVGESGIRTYALDTNVLIHDPNAVFKFEEHQVLIPMVVLEELDKLKVGTSAVAADAQTGGTNH